LIETSGTQNLAIDNNDGGNFRTDWFIPEDNLSDYREVSGTTPTTLRVTILMDALP